MPGFIFCWAIECNLLFFLACGKFVPELLTEKIAIAYNKAIELLPYDP
jgi:hypothetical protein